MSPRPGFPELDIPAAASAVEPISFATARGDDADPALDVVRRGIADVRLEVFVGEQAVPFVEEIDARDFEPTTIHILATGADGTPLGAARLLLEPEHPGQVHLGRLAVRRATRGTGLGARLVRAVEEVALERASVPLADDEARAAGAAPGSRGVTVILSAQEQAMGFYDRCGYRTLTGERYLDAGIWHQDMARTIARSDGPHHDPKGARMRIVVIGAGGIGGWLGARLAAAGQEVAFLVHGATLEALRTGGLTLTDADGAALARIDAPIASDDPAELLASLGGAPDYVLVTTKVDPIPALGPSLAALTGPGTTVVSTQNGVSAPGLLAEAVGREHVLPGVARVYAKVVERGRVMTMSGLGNLMLGEWDGGASPRVDALVEALKEAGIGSSSPDSIWAELWRKVAFVVPQGGLGAALDAPIGVLRGEYRDAFRAMVREVADVAAGLGHDVAEPGAQGRAAHAERVLGFADQQPADATTSMQRDIAAGLPSELDAQVGAVRRAGDEAGVPTPVFDLVWGVLEPRERSARGGQRA